MSDTVTITLILATMGTSGGAWKRALEMVRTFREYGCECHLIVPSVERVEVENVPDGCRLHGLRLPTALTNSITFATAVFLKVASMTLKDRQCVWVGGFVGLDSLGPSFVREIDRRSVNRFVILRGGELRGLKLRYEDKLLGRLRYRLRAQVHCLLGKVMLNRSDLLIAQSEAGLAEIQDTYGADMRRTKILPNNINASWIKDGAQYGDGADKGYRLRQEKNRLHVCFVGRITMKVKGLDVLVRAARIVKERGVNISVIVVGDGQDSGKLRRAIEKEGLEDTVEFIGWRNDPMRVMAKADLVVVPSRYDPFPNVILEALAVGVPVIGSKVDGIPTMLRDRELLFEPGQPELLADRIERAATDGEYLRRLARLCKACKKHLRFDWGERIYGLLEDVDQRNAAELSSGIR